jgi:alkylated DNA repair dioxygenase AlkB
MTNASKTAEKTQNIARKARHSTKGFLKTLERLHQKEPYLDYKKNRVIARIRKHNGKIYEEWIPVFDRGFAWTHTFHRGGVLTFRPKEVPVARLEEIEKEMGNCQWLQYKIRKVFEPRVHVLFSDHEGTGYKYGNLKMKAHDIAQLPKIHEFAKERAMDHKIQKWNIGADLVCYRDGQDGIGWHRDSSQGENIVESLIVSSPEEVRSLCIQALGDPQKGDEQLELFPNAGDMYSMDGTYHEDICSQQHETFF